MVRWRARLHDYPFSAICVSGSAPCYYAFTFPVVPSHAGPKSDASPNAPAIVARRGVGPVAGCGTARSASGFALAAGCAIPSLFGSGLLQNRRSQAGSGAAHASTKFEPTGFSDAFYPGAVVFEPAELPENRAPARRTNQPQPFQSAPPFV